MKYQLPCPMLLTGPCNGSRLRECRGRKPTLGPQKRGLVPDESYIVIPARLLVSGTNHGNRKKKGKGRSVSARLSFLHAMALLDRRAET